MQSIYLQVMQKIVRPSLHRSPAASQALQLNRAIADLYDAAVSVGLEEFRSVAFAIMGHFVPFDSACWASGQRQVTAGREFSRIHTMHLIGQPETVPYRFGDEFSDADEIYKLARATPGLPIRIEDTMSLAQYRSSRLYLEFTRHHRIELAIGTIHLNEIMGFFDYIALWRSDPDDHFSDGERMQKKLLSLHMVNAWKHCQLTELRSTPFTGSSRQMIMRRARALVDALGAIHVADAEFGHIMREIFPAWRGPTLPHEFQQFVASGPDQAKVAGIDCAIARNASLHILTIASAPQAMPLSGSEFDVARLYCTGLSNSEIARERGVSPVTVRNQLASVYRKLNIHSKVDLARLIN